MHFGFCLAKCQNCREKSEKDPLEEILLLKRLLDSKDSNLKQDAFIHFPSKLGDIRLKR